MLRSEGPLSLDSPNESIGVLQLKTIHRVQPHVQHSHALASGEEIIPTVTQAP